MVFVDRLFLLIACLASVARAEFTFSVPTTGEGPFPAIIFMANDTAYEKSQAAKIAAGWNFVGIAGVVNASTPEGVVAAVAAVKNVSSVDGDNIAIFAYGMASANIMSYALGGHGNDEVKAIVSFHGEMVATSDPIVNVTPKLLILSGGEDETAQQMMDLEAVLNNASAHWEITRYSGAEQGYTIFNSSQYNEFADSRSWASAYGFVNEAFGITVYEGAQPNSTSTVAVNYTDSIDDASLTGWLAMPKSMWERPLPAVVILPDWDGVNEYEKERATALAELGYVAFAADIYGSDKQYVETFPERAQLAGKYRANPVLYKSRIQTAIEQVQKMDGVLPDEIAIIGYCFGGTGVVLYALNNGTDAKAAVAFHGSYGVFDAVQADVTPYLLVLAGGDDFQHGNQTLMEEAFNSGNSDWEVTRYAGVDHGFTKFGSAAYDIVADARSWSSFLEFMQKTMPIPSPNGTTASPTDSPSMGPTISMSPTQVPTGTSEDGTFPPDTSSGDSDATDAPTASTTSRSSNDSAANTVGKSLSTVAMIIIIASLL